MKVSSCPFCDLCFAVVRDNQLRARSLQSVDSSLYITRQDAVSDAHMHHTVLLPGLRRCKLCAEHAPVLLCLQMVPAAPLGRQLFFFLIFGLDP